MEAVTAGGPSNCCGATQEASARITEGMGRRTAGGLQRRRPRAGHHLVSPAHMNMQDVMAPVTAQGALRDDAHHPGARDHRDRLRPLLAGPVPARVLLESASRLPAARAGERLGRRHPAPDPRPGAGGRTRWQCRGTCRALPSAACRGPWRLRRSRRRLDAIARSSAGALATIFHSCHREDVTLERGRPWLRVANWIPPARRERGLGRGGQLQGAAQRRGSARRAGRGRPRRCRGNGLRAADGAGIARGAAAVGGGQKPEAARSSATRAPSPTRRTWLTRAPGRSSAPGLAVAGRVAAG